VSSILCFLSGEKLFRKVGLSITVGILSGSAAAVFLIALEWATQTRNNNTFIIWGLPLAGLAIGLIYHHFGHEAGRGNNLIIDEIHNPKKILPIPMAPLVLGGTLLTHLFGGSAGREGTAVQMGASLSDQIARFFKIEMKDRQILLMAGAGAGFGAAIGTPFAGAVFGMEVIQIGKFKWSAWVECLVASFVGYSTSILLQAPHSQFPKIAIDSFHAHVLLWVVIAGIVFGLAARVFSSVTHGIEKLNSRFIKYPPLRPFIAGLILVVLYYIEGSYRYVGLGIPIINETFQPQEHLETTLKDPAFKTLFTAITVGSGFKGGEFVPLVFIGSTLGSALALILPVSLKILVAVGFAAVFAGAANAPIACSLMAIEIFGMDIAPYAVVGCFMSYFFSGYKGIYTSQIVHTKKHNRLLSLFKKSNT